MNKIKFLITVAVFTTLISGQQKPCESPAADQFDFWIGDWKLTWQDDEGNVITGSNKIEKILGGYVISENFYDPYSGFTGKSFSVYSTKLNKWLQTWVDNNGAYLDFEGGMIDDKMILSRSFKNDDKEIHQRMIFYNINYNSLDWNWEISTDAGETWQLKWKIHYERKDI